MRARSLSVATKPAPPTTGRRTLLLTGFGPFPAMPANATGVLVPALAEAAAAAFPGLSVHAEILATEWAAAPRRLDVLLRRIEPDVVLHFGVSARARGFEIEAVGRNVRADADDACGKKPASACVRASGPDTLASTLPVAAIVARLRALGLPAYASRDAGAYLCNAVLYHSLARAAAAPGLKRGFIHIPAALADARPGLIPRRGRAALDWPGALAGGIEIVAACLGHPTPRTARLQDVQRRIMAAALRQTT